METERKTPTESDDNDSQVSALEIMPLKAKTIKSMLIKEYDGFRNALRHPANALSFNAGYYLYAMDLMRDKLDACESYEDLDSFIQDAYRMTINEWIESL